MLNPVRTRFLAALLVLAFLAVACGSPWNTVTKPDRTATHALPAGETKLVFRTSAPAVQRATLADAGYLTVQLVASDGTIKFTSAAKAADGTYTVALKGLVAGEWTLRVRLYDSAATQNLLFYALQSAYLSAGTTNTVGIALYEPGTISGITLDYALTVDRVELNDEAGLGSPDPANPKPLRQGFPVDLDAVAVSSLVDALGPVPASIPGVKWSTNAPDVASVEANGRVTPHELGLATITATSTENGNLVAHYEVEVVPPLYGLWNLSWSDVTEGVSYRFDSDSVTYIVWDSNGNFEAQRGTYTCRDGLLKLHFTEDLTATASAAPVWVLAPAGATTTEIPVDVLANQFSYSSVGVSSIKAARPGLGGGLVFQRVDDISVEQVTLGGYGFNATVTRPVGSFTDDSLALNVYPPQAPVQGLVWTSSVPGVAVFRYQATDPVIPLTSYHSVLHAVSQGNATIRAYSLDTLQEVARYNLTVGTNSPPSLSISSPATIWVNYDSGDVPYSISTSDETGIFLAEISSGASPVEWYDWNFMNDAPDFTGLNSGLQSATLEYRMANLISGASSPMTIWIRVTDREGNVSAEKSVLVQYDGTAPSSTAQSGSNTIPNNYGPASTMTFTLADTDSGIDPASIVLDVTGPNPIGCYIVTNPMPIYNEASGVLTYSVIMTGDGAAGVRTVEVGFRDRAGNIGSATKNFTVTLP